MEKPPKSHAHLHVHSETLIRISQSGNISDSLIFSQKTKKFLGNTWKCIVSIGLASYSETKASSVGISKILFDLNGLDPPREEPFSSQESFITLETTLLGCVHPQLCRHSPFCFQIYRNYKKQQLFLGPLP